MDKDIYSLTYGEVMERVSKDKTLDYLKPIKDMRPFDGLNNALIVWDKNNEEHVIKLTEDGFVSWKSFGQELFRSKLNLNQ